MSNSSTEDEQYTLSTARRRLIRQSFGKDLGRTRGTACSLSNNIDDPFLPLSAEEKKKPFYRHKLLVNCEKAIHPINPSIPEHAEVLEVEPVSVRYHLRSFATTHLYQYGSNVDNIGVSTTSMPRMKQTSYQPDVAAREAAETFYRPHPQFDTIAERELGRHELSAISHIDIVESEDDEGRSRLTPKVWVPNVGYILGNDPLSHVGVDKLDNKKLGMPADGKRVITR
uniref:Uncharacterized protein n=1 Tax=Chenopodium quinoa TaxID=63459 RepID=A0A803N8W8_CHEQI